MSRTHEKWTLHFISDLILQLKFFSLNLQMYKMSIRHEKLTMHFISDLIYMAIEISCLKMQAE